MSLQQGAGRRPEQVRSLLRRGLRGIELSHRLLQHLMVALTQRTQKGRLARQTEQIGKRRSKGIGMQHNPLSNRMNGLLATCQADCQQSQQEQPDRALALVAAMTEPQRVRQALAYAAWLAYHGLEIDLATVLAAWEGS